MMKVGQIIENKGHEVWTVSPEQSVFDAIQLMDEKSVGALAVVSEGRLVGIVSERDYARKVILKNRTSRDTKVKEIMTRHIFHTQPNQTVDQCLVIMNDKRVRHLPVLNDGKLVGMISIGDVVKQIIADQQYTIQQLENYISWEESY